MVWAPLFFLPTDSTLVRLLEPGTYQLDMDIGEMFLNFPLYPNARKYCGVNLKGIKELDLGVKGKDNMVWTTLWMSFAPSSAKAVKHLGLAQEIAAGEPLDIDNPFYWSEIVLNLPG